MEPIKENLADSSYWDEGYEEYSFSPMPRDYPTVKLLYEHLDISTAENPKTVFEIGVYPGRFIYHFGKLNYELNGIDQTKFMPRMIGWLKKNNFRTGFFSQMDVNDIGVDKLYDVVFSAGFIEHFPEFENMIALHAKLVKPGGYVYITAPNFGGTLQYRLHKWVDLENLNRHHVPSMDVAKWEKVLLANNFEVIKSGYTGGIDFWVDKQKRNIFQKILLKLIKLLLPLAKRMKLPDNRSWSPECVIIARKKMM